jgi:hypothetical protein
MIIQDTDVDFASDCSTTRVIEESDTTKKRILEEQANKLHAIPTKKWVECDTYEQTKASCVVSSRNDATLNQRLTGLSTCPYSTCA